MCRRASRASGAGRAACRDGGFTLPELLVGLTIVGILSAALLGMIAVVLRNDEATGQRLAESQDVQQVVVYLPGDVQSAGPGTYDLAPGAASGCGVADAATNVLAMSWTQLGTTTRVSYRLSNEGGRGVLVRVECSGGAGTSVKVADELEELPAGWSPGTAPAAVTLSGGTGDAFVRLTLTMATGQTFTVDAARYNPAAILPAPPGTVVPPTTPPTAPSTTVEA